MVAQGEEAHTVNLCQQCHKEQLVQQGKPKLKKKKEMSHIERFVTEGSEQADELAKAGALLDEGFMAKARANTNQQEREEVYAALQYAASFHCLVEG